MIYDVYISAIAMMSIKVNLNRITCIGCLDGFSISSLLN